MKANGLGSLESLVEAQIGEHVELLFVGLASDHLVRDDDAIRNDVDLADRASSSCFVAPTICYHVPSPKAGARVGSKARS